MGKNSFAKRVENEAMARVEAEARLARVNMEKEKFKKQVSDDVIPDALLDQMGTTADGVPVFTQHEYQGPGDSVFDSAAFRNVSTATSYSKGSYIKCAHKHPPLKLTAKDGKEYTIYGGACGDPVHKDLDIYVALDSSTAHDPQAYPWHGSRQFIYFPITDMSTPKDAVEFKLMIDWLCHQILLGKSVHVGCLGGHGRTGMVLSAVAMALVGIEDAITYVREHYCEKAVETNTQAEWLHQHFGIKVVTGYKTKSYTSKSQGWGHVVSGKNYKDTAGYEDFLGKAEEVAPVRSKGNIWGTVA